jgi:hypothetical protein
VSKRRLLCANIGKGQLDICGNLLGLAVQDGGKLGEFFLGTRSGCSHPKNSHMV